MTWARSAELAPSTPWPEMPFLPGLGSSAASWGASGAGGACPTRLMVGPARPGSTTKMGGDDLARKPHLIREAHRGGCWLLGPDMLRTWARFRDATGGTSNSVGLRCARPIGP